MSQDVTERRRFTRFAFDARAELTQAEQRWSVQVIDLSLKGLLVQKPDNFSADSEQPFKVNLHLSGYTEVFMEVQLSHDQDGQLGFVCQHIDIDSISHLRRLIELNLGNEALLERELAALIES